MEIIEQESNGGNNDEKRGIGRDERLNRIELKQNRLRTKLNSLEFNQILKTQIRNVLVDLKKSQNSKPGDTTDEDDDDEDGGEESGDDDNTEFDVNNIETLAGGGSHKHFPPPLYHHHYPQYGFVESSYQNRPKTSARTLDNANKTSEWYWSMHRLYLGTEWSKIKIKLNSLKAHHEQCSQLLRKYEKFKVQSRPATATAKRLIKKELMDVYNDYTNDSYAADVCNSPAYDDDYQRDHDDHHNGTSRCTQVKPINLLPRRFIRFDDALKPYLNMLNYINENQYEEKLCKCSAGGGGDSGGGLKSCIICYMEKKQLRERYQKYSSDLVQTIYSEHSYSKMYTPCTSALATTTTTATSDSNLYNQFSNDLMSGAANDFDGSETSYAKGCNLNMNQYEYQLTHTPPPTPQQSGSSAGSGGGASDMVTDESDSAATLGSALLNSYNLTTLLQNTNDNLNTKSYLKLANLNRYNLYMSSNTYYMNLFESSYKNYYNNLILDAGNELDPNDVHKLPNIYDELRFYNSQNDENLLNGIINKQLKRKQLKRKWNNVYNYHHSVNLATTTSINGSEKFYLESTSQPPTHKRKHTTSTSSSSNQKRRLKRRSASSCSSNSSLNSNFTITSSTTNGGYHQSIIHSGHNGGSTTNFMILNDTNNKFDIDNIVIPYHMLCGSGSNGGKITLPQKQEIQTPQWRVTNTAGAAMDDSVDECLTDEFYRGLHEFNELKERYYSVFKKLEKEKLKQQQREQREQSHSSDTTAAAATTTSREKLDNLCLDEFKKLVYKLENEHNKRKNGLNNSHSQSNKSLSSLFTSIKNESHIHTSPWPVRKFPLNEAQQVEMSLQDNANK